MKKKISSILSLSTISLVFSQIEPEVIEVEKPFEPQVKEAVKIQKSPVLEPPEKKLPVQYTPIEVQVQKHFQTQPIQVERLNVLSEEKSLGNYLKISYGNNNTLVGTGFISHPLQSDQELGLYFRHWTTERNIQGSQLNDRQWETKAMLFYIANTENGRSKITGGYEGKKINFYGLSEIQQKAVVKINPRQIFNNIYAKVQWTLPHRKNYLDQIELNVRQFWDRYKNRETYIRWESHWLRCPMIERKLWSNWMLEADMDLHLSYQNTRFKEKDSYFEYLIAKVRPLLKLNNDTSHFKLGLDFSYNLDTPKKSSQLHFYPLAELYTNIQENVGLFAGIKSHLQNHTYYSLMQENPYLAPHQELKLTNTPYEMYFGLIVKSSTDLPYKLSYKIEASISERKDDLFFANAPLESSKNYGYENSFLAQYIDNNIYTRSIQIDYISTRKLELNLRWAYSAQKEVCNRPNLKGNLRAAYKILNDRISIETDFFYVGQRYDVVYNYNTPEGVPRPMGKIKLKAYTDTNLKSFYKITPRYSIFLQLNNLFNTSYYRYKNYRVQAFQILGGLTYKF